MSLERRIAIVGLVAVVLALAGVGYFLFANRRVDEDIAERSARALESIESFEQSNPAPAAEPEPGPTDIGSEPPETLASAEPEGPVPQPGEVVAIHRVPGADYGRLAIRHHDGTRTLLDMKCMRVDISAGNGICLSDNSNILFASFTVTFFDATHPEFPEIKSYESPLPSRARISTDGSMASTTGFVSGHSYEDITNEATTIVTIDEFTERGHLISLNQFDVEADAVRYNDPNRKFWGITWIDADRFYVTGLFGDTPEIMQGSRSSRSVWPVGWSGSCPSLSPDGSTVVFKATRPGGGFDLVAVDLESGDRWQLGETRSVDDQVEWLDDETILYALHPEGTESSVQPQFDIWKLSIAEGSEPELFLPAADSPTVVS